MDANVSVRDLRNHGGEVLRRVQRGETLTVSMSGQPVARLMPLGRISPTPADLVQRAKALPPVDYQAVKADLVQLFDTSLEAVWEPRSSEL